MCGQTASSAADLALLTMVRDPCSAGYRREVRHGRARPHCPPWCANRFSYKTKWNLPVPLYPGGHFASWVWYWPRDVFYYHTFLISSPLILATQWIGVMKRRKSLNLQVVHHYSAPKTQEKRDSSPLQQLIHKQLGQWFIVFDQKEIVALLFTLLLDHEEKSHHLDTFAGMWQSWQRKTSFTGFAEYFSTRILFWN